VVEHGLARLGALGVGQAHYRGRARSLCQALLAATLADLRWTWNWVARQGRLRSRTSDFLTRSSRTTWPGGWALLGLTLPNFWPYRSPSLAA
jgi:hypothetical protein